MSAREELKQFKDHSQFTLESDQENKSSTSFMNPDTSSQEGDSSTSNNKFKILSFPKLAEVFSKVVAPNSLDNIFTEGEIIIYTKDDINEEMNSLLSYEENRPFDVLLWEAKKAERSTEDMHFFHIIEDENLKSNSSIYLWNMKAFCFAYLMVMTRGSFPLISGASAGNKLPNLLTSRLNMAANSVEKDFAEKLSRIDMSKVDCKWMLNIDIKTMPDPIRNRIAKGTAGSRALKIILAAIQIVPLKETQLPENHRDAFAALVDVANRGSAYLSMHPAQQKVQSQIPNFYRSCLLLAAEHVGKNQFDTLKDNLNKIESFQKDKALQDLIVLGNNFKFGSGSMINGFNGKSYEQIVKLFGNSL